jgi:mono/diheme cytochrome c family protein
MAEAATNAAVCVVNDIGVGVDGIAPGQIKYLRIAEPIGWPYDNVLGGQRYGEDHGYGGPGAERKNLLNWTPVRILGDVPVERDGSAHFTVPADTAVYFQLLDENRVELRRMRSFISFQPGETRACVGCHESRAVAPVPSRASLAAQREPSPLVPPPWGDRPVSFLRDIQPVLDRNCVSCHSGLKPAGGLDFFGGLTSFDAKIPGYGHNRAFETIIEKGLVSISAARAQDASITPPLAYGARKSKLVTALDQGSHAGKVKLSEDDRLRLVMWIDANAPYHDQFVNKRTGRAAYDLASDAKLGKAIAEIHVRRCAGCHKPEEISRLDWIDVAQPERTLFLSAPPAKERGGLGRCAKPAYSATTDKDYKAVRRLVLEAVRKAVEQPRRDLQTAAGLGVAGSRTSAADIPFFHNGGALPRRRYEVT